MIRPDIIAEADRILDGKVSLPYRDQPLAQDWARTAKVVEELGEAITELISWTGQNPRKQASPGARERMLAELADTCVTAALAIQHFTKNTDATEAVILAAQQKCLDRLAALKAEAEGGGTP